MVTRLFLLLTLLPLFSFNYLQAGTVSVLENTKYYQQMQALQHSFCGVEKQEEIKNKIRTLVAARIADLPEEKQKDLHPEHVVEETLATLWSTFHIKELCLEQSLNPTDFTKGLAIGAPLGLGLQIYGVNTAIHELGHMAAGTICYCNTNPTMHVVKFDVLSAFVMGLVHGHGDFSYLGDFLNPFSTTGGNILGWTSFNFYGAPQLTSAGTAMGISGSNVFVYMAGVMFTSISQITGIIVGLNIRHRYPVLGYGMIAASATGYTLELINWMGLAFSSSSVAGGSDLFRTAALLGVAPIAISGMMFGVSAGALLSYVVISKYLKHLKQLRTSARSLVDEGFLAAIKGESTNVLDELLSNYPNKERFDKRLEKMSAHIKQMSMLRITAAVQQIEKKMLKRAAAAKEGKEVGEEAGGFSFSDYLPDRETLGKLQAQFHHYRQVKKFNNELRAFHTYIAQSDTVISLAKQDKAGHNAIHQVMAGKFAKTPGFIFEQTFPLPVKVRDQRTDDYLEAHQQLPMSKMVRANIKRMTFNEEQIKAAARSRWKQIISEENFHTFKSKIGRYYSATHLFYRTFVNRLQFNVEQLINSFSEARMNNNVEAMNTAAKNLLKKVFHLSKEQRDIPAAVAMLTAYSQGIAKQTRVHLEKRGYLDVIDQDSCQVEINFLCTIGKIFHQAHIESSKDYQCPLSFPNSCTEGNLGRGIIGPAH